MTPSFAAKLDFKLRLMNVGAQKIDASLLIIYDMVVSRFSLWDIQGKVRFFEKTFFVAHICIEVVQAITFLALSNEEVQFRAERLT